MTPFTSCHQWSEHHIQNGKKYIYRVLEFNIGDIISEGRKLQHDMAEFQDTCFNGNISQSTEDHLDDKVSLGESLTILEQIMVECRDIPNSMKAQLQKRLKITSTCLQETMKHFCERLQRRFDINCDNRKVRRDSNGFKWIADAAKFSFLKGIDPQHLEDWIISIAKSPIQEFTRVLEQIDILENQLFHSALDEKMTMSLAPVIKYLSAESKISGFTASSSCFGNTINRLENSLLDIDITHAHEDIVDSTYIEETRKWMKSMIPSAMMGSNYNEGNHAIQIARIAQPSKKMIYVLVRFRTNHGEGFNFIPPPNQLQNGTHNDADMEVVPFEKLTQEPNEKETSFVFSVTTEYLILLLQLLVNLLLATCNCRNYRKYQKERNFNFRPPQELQNFRDNYVPNAPIL